jgi:hypothetical protein
VSQLFADYGDGVLHYFGWYAAQGSDIKKQVAACRGLDRQTPRMLYLDRQVPDGAALCHYCELGERMPVTRGRRGRRTPGTVPNAPIRAAFEASGLTLGELAHRMGMFKLGTRQAETSRLSRMLGVNAGYRWRNGTAVKQLNMTRENAARVIRALHLDPRDFGL